MAAVTETFNRIVGHLEYPMFIVTARVGDEPLGCLVGFTTQASINPPRFLICLSHANHTFRRGGDAELFGVHCVPAEREDLARLFGGETGDEVDKFVRTDWREGHGGVPLLDGCEDWFVGRVVGRLDAGDHDAYVLEPVAAGWGGQEDFTFHRAKRIAPGHAP